MATTVATGVDQYNWPYLVRSVQLSTIVPNASLDLTHGGPSGASPMAVGYDVLTEATSGDPVVAIEHYPLLDVPDSGTTRLKIKTVGGGDLTGAVIRVLLYFVDRAAGGTGTANTEA